MKSENLFAINEEQNEGNRNDFEFAVNFIQEMANEVVEECWNMIEKATGVSKERIIELANADLENRCIVFQHGYDIAKEIYCDGQNYILEASGVTTKEEYDKYYNIENE